MTSMMRFSWAAACALLVLTACGGGGGSAPVPAQPTAGTQGTANVVVQVPAAVTTASSLRSTRDVSASAESVRVALGTQSLTVGDVTATSKLCQPATGGGRTCTIAVSAPAGNDDFTVTAYDQPAGAGNVLATGTVQATLTAGQAQTVAVTLAGTIAALRLALQNAFLPAGTAATTNVVVQALDADGNTILGTYPQPVTLADADTSGVTKLSTTSVTSTSATVTLSYNGAPFTSTTISASASGLPAVSAAFAPAPTVVAEYTVPPVAHAGVDYQPGASNLVIGPDGNIWSPATSGSGILKITPTGGFTVYPLDSLQAHPVSLVVAPDGALWFLRQGDNTVGRITTTGTISAYTPPGASPTLAAMTLGSDKNLWFVDNGDETLVQLTTAGTFTSYPLPAKASIGGIATGPDGNLWLTDLGNDSIDVFSTAGSVVASHPIPTANAGARGIAPGPDGNMWFAEYNVSKVARITPAGVVSEFPLPTAEAGIFSVLAGPDGNVWFAESGQGPGIAGKIGYVTPDGKTIRDFPVTIDIGAYHVQNLLFDHNGLLWFTEFVGPGATMLGTMVY
jgi:virginiamycin B lyase